jgi:hypothetical protein
MKRCSRQKWLVKSEQAKAHASSTSPHCLSAKVRSGADVLTETLNQRKEHSALSLSKYVEDASQRLEESEGDLRMSQAGTNVVRIRQGVWPETTATNPSMDLTVILDETGRVERMHARLAALLNGGSDPYPELAGCSMEEYVCNRCV